jgi:UDP-2,3-diacylglucosamine hydrolase
MHTLFISDLHLDTSFPRLTELFLQFINNHTKNAEALYILGDLFEVWIGDDALTDYHWEIIHHLKKLSQRMPVYFLPGNRDFLIGSSFAQLTGITLLKDPSVIHLYGIPTLLMHGDSLCTHDRFYQSYRKLVHSDIIKKTFLSLPLRYRKKIASRLRDKSKKRGRNLDPQLLDVTSHLIPTIMKKFNVQQLIYGHTHKPAIYLFGQPNDFKQCYVLSDWHKKGNMLVCAADKGEKRLTYFD